MTSLTVNGRSYDVDVEPERKLSSMRRGLRSADRKLRLTPTLSTNTAQLIWPVDDGSSYCHE
jgi:hypothetical protein